MSDETQVAAKQDGSLDLEALYAQVTGKAPEKQEAKVETTEKADDKVIKSTTSSVEDGEKADEDTLKSQVEGLTKELGRVRKDRNSSIEQVQELREALANVRGQLESLAGNKGGSDTPEAKLSKYSDTQLVQGQGEWEEAILDAREALRKAQETGNDTALDRANQNLKVARHTLSAIRQELVERTKRVGLETARAQSEATRVVQEVVDIYEQAYESFPTLKDKDSDLWKAGNDAYNQHPSLMKQLGPLGELVAVALAVADNPELVGGSGKKATAARKELLSEINDQAEKSLLKGGAKAKSKGTPNFEGMAGTDFDAMVHKVKMGG